LIAVAEPPVLGHGGNMNDKPNLEEPTQRPRGRPRKYPFDELEQGEHRIIPGKTRDQIAACMAAAERRTGFAFFAFNVPDGVRICRYSADIEEYEKHRKEQRRQRRQGRARFGAGY